MADSRHIELGWQSNVIACTGGLVLNTDSLTLGTSFTGAATILQNFESSLDGGYRRINGYIPYDANVVPGATNNPVTGVKVALGGVFAVRKTSGGDNAIYFSTGSGWTGPLNMSSRTGAVTKARAIQYGLTDMAIVFVDGQNYAWKYDGTTETVINGTGAPKGAKYVAEVSGTLFLSGYGSGTLLSISAPADDTSFDGAAGAAEINVGDIVTGLKAFRSTLVIFCQHSIKTLTGSDVTTYNIQEVAKAVGCIGQDTIQEIAGDLVYLADSTFRSYAATNKIDDVVLDSVSQNIRPLIVNLIAEGLSSDQYCSTRIAAKGQYRLYLNNPNTDTTDTIGFLGRVQDTPTVPHGSFEWSTLKGVKPYSIDSDYQNNMETVVFGDPSSGMVFQLESGNDFNGTPIEAIYQSPNLTFADASLRKVFQKITLNTEIEGNFGTQLNLILDTNQPGIIQPGAIQFSSGNAGGTTYGGGGIYGTATYGAFTLPIFKQNLIGSGFTGAFQFYSIDSNAPFRIDSYQIQFTMKSRR